MAGRYRSQVPEISEYGYRGSEPNTGQKRTIPSVCSSLPAMSLPQRWSKELQSWMSRAISHGPESRTSVEGLYAAGDVCVKGLRQVVTAVGEGALAATELERYAAGMQEKTGLHPAQANPEGTGSEGRAGESDRSFCVPEEQKQTVFPGNSGFLEQVFEKMEETLCLKLCLNDSQLSAELEHYITELGKLTDKLKVQTERNAPKEEELPCVRVYKMDGTFTGLAFHGVPGGHEFTSFILGLIMQRDLVRRWIRG